MNYSPYANLVLFCLLTAANLVTADMRCGYESEKQYETQENVESYGTCQPYSTGFTHEGIPCDDLYTQHETYVYLSPLRGQGSLEYYIYKFRNTQLFFNFIPMDCIVESRKILCQYYLPTCGNSTIFQPPTSVCQDVCEHFKTQCPQVYQQLSQYFTSNEEDLAPLGLTMINCSNTGDFIDPLKHCCTDLDIEIPCTRVNDSGDCVKSDSVTPSPSTHPLPTKSMTEGSNDTPIGAPVGVALSLLVTTSVLLLLLCLLIWYRRYRRGNQTGKKEKSIESTLRNRDFIRYRDTVERPLPSPAKREERVASGYIRQLTQEMLLIPGTSLTLLDTIGQGEFGIVYRGRLTGWQTSYELNLVAVKTLKGMSYNTTEPNSLMEESLKMAKFNHPNVMRLIGVCIDKGPSPYIVMPYMSYGSLLSYLKKQRAELTLANCNNQELVTATQCKLLSMCHQVAKGMSYLANCQFLHRDLAARNCMIDENFVLKVADFGLSEDIYARNYFRQTGLQNSEGEASVKLPVRWMALESLHDGIFTEKTDVWSFGVTMWEIFSCGKNPYPGVDAFTLVKFLDGGGRLNKPENAACSQEIHFLMCECWDQDPEGRPTFSHLVSVISERLESLAGYLDFNPIWSSGGQAKVAPYDHLVPEQPKESQNNGKNSYGNLNPTVIISDEN